MSCLSYQVVKMTWKNRSSVVHRLFIRTLTAVVGGLVVNTRSYSTSPKCQNQDAIMLYEALLDMKL